MNDQPRPDLVTFLRKHKIHITKPRLLALKAILQRQNTIFCVKSLIHQDESINRVSAHRVLQLLVKKEILKKVPNTRGVVEYTFIESPIGKWHYPVS